MTGLYRVETSGGVGLTGRLNIVEAVKRCRELRDMGVVGARVERVKVKK